MPVLRSSLLLSCDSSMSERESEFPRLRPFRIDWFLILVSVATLLQIAAVRPAEAGCHAPDRPVLSTRLSWEHDPSQSAGTRLAATAPAILTHLPCPGELPHHVSSQSSGLVPAWIAPSRAYPP